MPFMVVLGVSWP